PRTKKRTSSFGSMSEQSKNQAKRLSRSICCCCCMQERETCSAAVADCCRTLVGGCPRLASRCPNLPVCSGSAPSPVQQDSAPCIQSPNHAAALASACLQRRPHRKSCGQL